MRKHNFNAGPSILPLDVLKKASSAVTELDGIGMSILEISHRSKEFDAIISEARNLIKELLGVPEGYSILFLQGGASLQFCMVPYNLLDHADTAVYLETGIWAMKAAKEAEFFGHVEVAASSADANFNFIPKEYDIPDTAAYFHVTTNNTIYGTQMKELPDSPIPLVADMSSDIFSRPVDVAKTSIIYGGAQKNLGPAGVTIVIIKDDILGKIKHVVPTLLNYQTHIDKESLYHTPSVFSIYTSLQTLRWIKEKGGLEEIGKINSQKASILYNEIDNNPQFEGVVVKEDRSDMNITFILKKQQLQQSFLVEAADAGIVGIKGHRSVGGFRASLYNAMPQESVQVLVDLMSSFGKKNG